MAQVKKNLGLAVLMKTHQVVGVLMRNADGEAPPRAKDESDNDYQTRLRNALLPNGITLNGPTGKATAGALPLQLLIRSDQIQLQWVEPERGLLASPIGATVDSSGNVVAASEVTVTVKKNSVAMVDVVLNTAAQTHAAVDIQVRLENQNPLDPTQPEQFVCEGQLAANSLTVSLPVPGGTLKAGARYAAIAFVPGVLPELVEIIP